MPGDYKGGWKSPLSCPLVAGASRGILPGCRGERAATRSMTARSHLIWCPKRRRALGDAELRAWVAETFRAIAEEFGFAIKELAFEDDQVHPFLEFPPKDLGRARRRNAQKYLREPRLPPVPRTASAVLVGRTLGGRLRGAYGGRSRDRRPDPPGPSSATSRSRPPISRSSSERRLTKPRPLGGEGHVGRFTAGCEFPTGAD